MRHALATRIWHWANLLCLVILFMSGLNISNAHPRLYWGESGFDASHAWLILPRFPGWMTSPGYYSLASARDWHIVFAWIFALGLLIFMIASLVNRHFRRDLVTSPKDWKPSAVMADIRAHLKFNFHRAGTKFNFLQKASYGVVIFILLPLMIVTGMAMSPGMDAAWPFLTEMFGGRQSARSIHFIVAWLLAAFLVVHVLLVLLADPVKQLRDMIFGGQTDEKA